MNRCEYCAKLAAVENCEMLVLDALNGNAPQIVAILGTRTPALDMDAFARAREYVVDAVRRRWPDAEYAYEVEFTTGYGPRSGGLRRPHWNWFWKNVPVEDVEQVAGVVVGAWCRHVDALPEHQYVAAIRNEIGLTKYVTEHFMKASQRPPAGFRGQRFCCSRRYFGEGVTVATARARARESLRRKRELHKAIEAGFGPHDAELVAHQALELAARTVWVLTNERGVRIGKGGHDPRRMVLHSDVRPGSEVIREIHWTKRARQAANDWREWLREHSRDADSDSSYEAQSDTVNLSHSPAVRAVQHVRRQHE